MVFGKIEEISCSLFMTAGYGVGVAGSSDGAVRDWHVGDCSLESINRYDAMMKLLKLISPALFGCNCKSILKGWSVHIY